MRPGAKTPDPFHEFASEAEIPILSCKAKMCAVHTLIEGPHDPGGEIMDAVRTLVAETWASIEQIHEMHTAAFDASNKGRR